MTGTDSSFTWIRTRDLFLAGQAHKPDHLDPRRPSQSQAVTRTVVAFTCTLILLSWACAFSRTASSLLGRISRSPIGAAMWVLVKNRCEAKRGLLTRTPAYARAMPE